MALEIKNTKTDKANFINYIVYGDSGVGKTSLIKQFTSENVLVLSAEDGLLSVKDHSVDYVNVKSLQDVKEVIQKLIKDQHKFVFIDSITELSQNHYIYLLNKYKKIAAENRKDVSSYGLKIWGDFGNDFSEVFKELRRLEKTVVAIALEKEKENEIGQRVYMPDIYGKTAERIIAWFDECFRMFIKDGERVFLTGKTELSWAKDRSSKLSKLEKADIFSIHKKILGTK